MTQQSSPLLQYRKQRLARGFRLWSIHTLTQLTLPARHVMPKSSLKSKSKRKHPTSRTNKLRPFETCDAANQSHSSARKSAGGSASRRIDAVNSSNSNTAHSFRNTKCSHKNQPQLESAHHLALGEKNKLNKMYQDKIQAMI